MNGDAYLSGEYCSGCMCRNGMHNAGGKANNAAGACGPNSVCLRVYSVYCFDECVT